MRAIDFSRLVIGSAATAAFAVGLGAAFLRDAQRTPDSGPTAAALENAFGVVLGSGLGLVAGSALAAVLVRHGPRFLSGFLAALSAYLLALAPVIVFSGPSDVELSQNFEIAVVLVLPACILAAFGATLGSGIAALLRQSSHDPA